MQKVNKAEFAEKTKTGVSLVKFGAAWCGPCVATKPVLEEVEKSCDGVTFLEVDVDEEVELAKEFGIRGIPFFLKMKDGEPVSSLAGQQTKEAFQKLILGDELDSVATE
jgi:thioredoxin 1